MTVISISSTYFQQECKSSPISPRLIGYLVALEITRTWIISVIKNAHTSATSCDCASSSCAEISALLCFHNVVIRCYLCQLSQAPFFSESTRNNWNPNISHWNVQRGWQSFFLSCLPSRLVPLTKIKGSSCLTCSTWFGITLHFNFHKQKFACERFLPALPLFER